MRKLIWTTLVAAGLGAATAQAKTCELAINSTDAMQFDKKELTVAADCKSVKLTMKHTGKLPKSAMGHNWVLSATADKKDIVAKAPAAGLAKDYVPESDKILAKTTLIGGGETTSVTFDVSKLKKGGDYSYYCTFPGHAAIMTGKLIYK